MLFNSFSFLLFFPLVTLGFFMLPHRFRWGWLLAASCFFYMYFKPIYVLILLFTIVIDYFAGILIERTTEPRRKKRFLIASLVANIGVLAVFKYYNFLNGNVSGLLSIFGHTNPIPFLKILLPIGLSFHTFQAMSYTIEVYRGRQKAEHHFGIYALYVMFYPQLVAGPIERPQNILHQIHEYHPFRYEDAANGMKRMLWGFFKKLVVADRLSIYVDAVYSGHAHHSALSLIVATIFFGIQVYCDFSGYSDIALGSAQVMGFRLMENFRRPWFSRSIGEFWSRWHISLSSWFRDYVYLPLGGNRVTRWRLYSNLMIVFMISGLWHGANWNYVVWGALNAIYLMAEQAFLGPGSTTEARGFARVIATLRTIALTMFAFIFFRAYSIDAAFDICRGLVERHGPLFVGVPMQFAYCLLGIALLLAAELTQEYRPGTRILFQSPRRPVRYASYATLVMTILLIGVFDGGQFIYFQF